MHGYAAVHFQSAIRCTLADLELTLRELLCSWSKYSAVCTSRSCSTVTSTGVTSYAAPYERGPQESLDVFHKLSRSSAAAGSSSHREVHTAAAAS